MNSTEVNPSRFWRRPKQTLKKMREEPRICKNYLKKLNLRNWIHLGKNRKAGNEVVQRTKARVAL